MITPVNSIFRTHNQDKPFPRKQEQKKKSSEKKDFKDVLELSMQNIKKK